MQTANSKQQTANSKQQTANSHNCVQKPDENLERIHVALSVYDPKGTYSQHAGVVMTSIFENTRNPVIIYLLHDETLTNDNRQKFLRTAEKYNQSIEFIDVSSRRDALPKNIKQFFYKMYSSVAVLYRLMIPEIIQADKVIYLDADIIVTMDIQELWNVDLNNNCIAAKIDEAQIKNTHSFTPIKIFFMLNKNSPDYYFNSGVLVMNSKLIRENYNFFDDAMKWLMRHSHSAIFADQDVLNAKFFGHVVFLDERFNKFAGTIKSDQDISNMIIHSAGAEKDRAWVMNGTEPQKLYWKLYARSAWGENKSVDEIIDTIANFINSVPPEKPKRNIIFRAIRSMFKMSRILFIELLYKLNLRS